MKLKVLTKAFALAIVRLVDEFPHRRVGWVIGDQLARSGTSVAANYRAACRGRSKAEFISRLGVVEEEADESALWLELIIDGKVMKKSLVEPLWVEANELVAIMTSSRKTAGGSLSSSGRRVRRTPLVDTIANQKSKF